MIKTFLKTLGWVQEDAFCSWRGGCTRKSVGSSLWGVVSDDRFVTSSSWKLIIMQFTGTTECRYFKSFRLSLGWNISLLIQTKLALINACLQFASSKQFPSCASIWQNCILFLEAFSVNTRHASTAKAARLVSSSIPKQHLKSGCNADICIIMLPMPLPISTKHGSGFPRESFG